MGRLLPVDKSRLGQDAFTPGLFREAVYVLRNPLRGIGPEAADVVSEWGN